MTSAQPRLSRVLIIIVSAGGTLALGAAAPASAAGYLKLGDIKGEVAGHKDHKGEIEVLSWSFGATQTSHPHGSAGMGAGKVSMSDLSATSASAPSSTNQKTRGASVGKPNMGKGKVEHEWKVEEGESARPAPGGVSVSAGDLDGDGRAELASPRDAASGQATGKRQHKPLRLTMPLDRSAGSLTVLVPAGMCKFGARYSTAELSDAQKAYKMTEVMITGCAPASSSSSRPMESLSLNYSKIEY